MTEQEKMRYEIIQFADKHMSPYRIKSKIDGTEELIPKLCPFCHGGSSEDEETFALSLNKGVYVCKRGTCGQHGTFGSLAEHFGEEHTGGSFTFQTQKKKSDYILPSTELKPPTEKIYSYFESRKISRKTVDAMKIASDDKGMIVFPFYMDGINVFEKFRRPWKPNDEEKKKKEWRSPGTKPVLFNMDSCSFSQPLIITEGQCFPPSAEILTPSGWTLLEQYDGKEEVCEVLDDLSAKFVKPTAIIRKEYTGDLIDASVSNTYSSVTTPDHHIVLKNHGGELIKKCADNVPKSSDYDSIPISASLCGEGIELTDRQISITTGVFINGQIDKNDSSYRYCRFEVKDKALYTKMTKLLSDEGIEVKSWGKVRGDIYHIIFPLPSFITDCHIPSSWAVSATKRQRGFILDELAYWNERASKKMRQSDFIFSSREDADTVQLLAHTCERACSISFVHPKSFHLNYKENVITYKVTVYHDRNVLSVKRWNPKYKPYSGMVYCVSVPSGMILVRQNGCVTVTGNCDAMALYEAGITNVTSVPSGCDDTSWIENCYDWLEKFKKIILFGDNDDPGRKMVQAVSKRLDESRCFIVEDYPLRPDGTECKDANEILIRNGDFELIDMVENAKPIPIKGIIDLASVSPYDPTSVPRIKTMIPALDEAVGGLTEGGLTVITGKAGDGKSTVSGVLLLNAIEQGHSVCAYSGELKKEKFQEWINLQCAGSDYITLKYDPIRGKQIPVVPYKTQERIMEYYRGKFFLFDNNELFESNQAESILQVFTIAVRRYGCKLFLVDNLMTSLSDSDEETKAQGKFVNTLKKFATRFGAHVLIVCHPRKTKAGEQLRKDDVGGNSAIVNLADNAIVVEHPNLRIIKNREGGIQKIIECCYCGDSRRIYQMDKGDLNHFSWNREGIEPPSPRADSLPEYGISYSEKEPF